MAAHPDERPGAGDGGHVCLQNADQPEKEILAESESRFFMTDNLDARLVFEKDSIGRVTSVSLEFGKLKAAALRRARKTH